VKLLATVLHVHLLSDYTYMSARNTKTLNGSKTAGYVG